MSIDLGKSGGMAAAVAPEFVLDRRQAVPALVGRHEDFLIVTGLAGTAKDVASLTRDGAHAFTMAGAMGAACMTGLGLALARSDKRGLVLTGDGELLMNVGALATIAVSLGVDLEKMAIGAGIKLTRTISREADIADGARLIRAGNGTAFVLLRVKPSDPPGYKRNMDAAACRVRFKTALAQPQS